MFISHKTGKKACTHFRFLGAYGYYELWEATASFMRPHQIRYHAADQGLVIVGEYLYGEELPLLLSQFKRKYTGRDRERPLYEGLYLHMTLLLCVVLLEIYIQYRPLTEISVFLNKCFFK